MESAVRSLNLSFLSFNFFEKMKAKTNIMLKTDCSQWKRGSKSKL